MSKPLLVHFGVLITLIALVVLRAGSPAMTRPFELDELLTVQNYTWVGLRDDGEVAQLGHIDEFRALPRPGLRHLLMGTYCGAGRWPEPNNHIPHSLLVNLSVAGDRSEWAARLPALLATLVFAMGLYWLCGPVLGWRAAAPLAAIWAWFAPYLTIYGQTARGYSGMLTLQVLLLLALFWLARRPSSLLRGAVCALIAAASFLNLVNLALDWLLPVYLAFYCFPPLELAPGEARAAWRKNILAQVLAVGAVGAMFLISHLPSVYSSAQQYGLGFSSASECFDLLWRMGEFLFPGKAWVILGLLAVAGWVVLSASRRCPPLAALVPLTLGVSLAHFLATKKMPFERGMGYLLPLAMLSAAFALQFAIEKATVFWQQALLWCAGAALTVLLILPSLDVVLADERLTHSLELANKLEPADAPTTMLYGYGVDYLTRMYWPQRWDYVETISPNQRLQVVAFLRYQDQTGFNPVVRAGPERFTVWRTSGWEYKNYPAVELFDVIQIVGETRVFPDPAGPVAKALIFWYPDPAQLGVSAKEHFEHMDRSGVRYLPRHRRYQAKLDLYTNLECFVGIAESKEEYVVLEETVRRGIDRFGGRAVVFIPQLPRKK